MRRKSEKVKVNIVWIFLCVFLLSVLPSKATTYFQNFENVTTGGDSPPNRVYVRLNTAENDNKWNEYGSGGSDYSPFIMDEEGGTRVLGMTYGYSSGWGWGNSLKRDIDPITKDDPAHNFKFDFKTFTPNSTSDSILQVTLQKAGWQWGIFINISWSTDDRSIYVSEATSSRTLSTSWTDEVWYTVECDNIDVENKTYDINIYEKNNPSNSITGGWVRDVNFNWQAGGSGYQGQLNQLTLVKYYQPYKVYLDNLQIVPEPSSLASLVLSALVPSIIRKRK